MNPLFLTFSFICPVFKDLRQQVCSSCSSSETADVQWSCIFFVASFQRRLGAMFYKAWETNSGRSKCLVVNPFVLFSDYEIDTLLCNDLLHQAPRWYTAFKNFQEELDTYLKIFPIEDCVFRNVQKIKHFWIRKINSIIVYQTHADFLLQM